MIPTMNEAANVGWVLDRLPIDTHEVIVVDGRSTDDTVHVVRRHWPSARILLQPARGKGAALAAGLLSVTGDIAVMIDADGSMDPAEIPSLVGALLAGADVVKGSRATAGGGSHDLSAIRRLGNWALTQSANMLYRQRWRELCYGYAAFWADVVPLLGLTDVGAIAAPGTAKGVPGTEESGPSYGRGFEIEAILFCRAARVGLRVAEVFSFEHRRRFGDSNLATWRDGWRVLTAVVRERTYRGSGQLARHVRTYPLLPALLAPNTAPEVSS